MVDLSKNSQGEKKVKDPRFPALETNHKEMAAHYGISVQEAKLMLSRGEEEDRQKINDFLQHVAEQHREELKRGYDANVRHLFTIVTDRAYADRFDKKEKGWKTI